MVKKTIKKTKVKAVVKKEKPVGVVQHYYGGIEVGIIKFNQPVKVGAEIKFKGATTDFSQKIASMQYEHAEIPGAKKGQEVGIKVDDKVREGDEVFLVE